MNLDKINDQKYISFIKKNFEENSRKISLEAVEYILELTTNHTYFTQRLCHEIYSLQHKVIDKQTVLETLQSLLRQNESIYYQYRNMLSVKQWKLLESIAKEEELFKPYANTFLSKYNLGQSAGVKRTLESLLSKELIYYHGNIENPYFEVQDKFLMKWFQFN